MTRGWWVPLVLALVLALELALTGGRELPSWPPDAEALDRTTLFELHVLANRGIPRGFSSEQAAALSNSPDPLRRDFAATFDVTRSAGEEAVRAFVDEPGGAAGPDRELARFFLRYQVRSPDLLALDAYFDALATRRAEGTER